MSTRRSNSAKPEDLVKVLRSHLPKGLDKKYLDHEPQMIVAAYEELIADILLRTARPTKVLLQAAAVKSWEQVKGSEAETWAERVSKAVSYCYNKRLQVSTGSRLSPPVRRIIQQINKHTFNAAQTAKAKPKRTLKPVPSMASDATTTKRKRCKSKPVDGKQAKHDHTDSPSRPSSKAMSIEELRNLYGLPATSNPSSSSKGDLPLVDVDAEIVESSCEEIEDVGEGAQGPEGGPAKAAPKPLQFWDSSKLAMVRSVGGKKIFAKMKEGPNGFLTAEFDGESPLETEVPNLVLHGADLKPGPKKPKSKPKSKAKGKAAKSKATVVKKPAAAEVAPSVDHDAPEAAADAPAPGEGDEQPGYQYSPQVPVPEDAIWTCMYYKRDHKIGVRFLVRFEGKKFEKQVFSFGGRLCDKPEKDLRKIGWKAVAKMQKERQPPAVVESWAKQQV